MSSFVVNHKPLLEIISQIRHIRWGKLSIPRYGLLNVSTYSKFHENNLFSFKFRKFSRKVGSRVPFGKELKNIQYSNKHFNLVLEDFFVGIESMTHMESSVGQFYTKGYSRKKEYYYRLIIPLKKQLNFHYQIEEFFFVSDLGYKSRTGLTASFEGDTVYGCVFHKNKSEYYLSIESYSSQDWQSFSDKAHAFKNALGYLSGHLPGDYGIYFVYDKAEMSVPVHFYYKTFRNSIISNYSPVYSNPFAYIKNRKLADKFYKTNLLRPLTTSEFSNLCQKIYENKDFNSCLVLIMESSVASLLFMPGGFSIALETLSDIIIEGSKKSKRAPIKSKFLSKKIRKECGDVIDKYKDELEEGDLKTLLGRIEQLNQVTNRARLQAPFDELKIMLLKEDIEILETRNDFLHGRFPDITKAGPSRGLDRINRDLYYAAMRFYTLLSILILKWIGYDNYVVNYPAVQAKFCKVHIREVAFRKV